MTSTGSSASASTVSSAANSAANSSMSMEDKKKALEKRFAEKRPPLAYAKLCGRVFEDAPFESFLTHLPTELGRGPIIPGNVSTGARICLGEQKAISRQHARIFWNSDRNCFQLQCLGKNGMLAAGSFVSKDQVIDLVSKMPLKIGPARVYFLLAIRSPSCSLSGFKLLQKCFEKHKQAASTGLTVQEMCQQILDLFPKSEHEFGGKPNLQSFVREFVVVDTEHFVKVSSTDPNDPTPRFRMKFSTPTLTPALTANPTPSTSTFVAQNDRKRPASASNLSQGAASKKHAASLPAVPTQAPVFSTSSAGNGVSSSRANTSHSSAASMSNLLNAKTPSPTAATKKPVMAAMLNP